MNSGRTFDVVSGRGATVRWMMRLPLETLRDVRTLDCGPVAYTVLSDAIAALWAEGTTDPTARCTLPALAQSEPFGGFKHF